MMQNMVALSTMEAENMALCEASKKAVWRNTLTQDVAHLVTQSENLLRPVNIKVENCGCIIFSKNPALLGRPTGQQHCKARGAGGCHAHLATRTDTDFVASSQLHQRAPPRPHSPPPRPAAAALAAASPQTRSRPPHRGHARRGRGPSLATACLGRNESGARQLRRS